MTSDPTKERADFIEEKTWEMRLGRSLFRVPAKEIEADPGLKREIAALVKEKEQNEIKYFAPHGKARYGHDCGFNLVSMADWISDRDHTLCMNCSPNQVGKTCHAVIKAILSIIPCNPNWPLFKENGVRYHAWEGPKTLVVMGYNKSQLVNAIWPEYQRWMPDEELGPFREIGHGGTRTPSWRDLPIVPLKCGSKIIYGTYEQDASTVAGIKADVVHADEQMPLVFFNELDERGRTRGGVKWIFPFTPHRVDGRQDTGASGWLFDVWKGLNTHGHTVLRSRIPVDDVPDYIYSKEQKKAAYTKNIVIPRKSGDENAIMEGEARYYGLFQRSSGLYYPEVVPAIHFIDWTYDDIKDKGWTHYRSMDYGVSNATSCGLWAVSPNGDYFRYDEYYVKGHDAVFHAPEIIRHCGNEPVEMDEVKDKPSNQVFKRYREKVKRQYYHRTVLDWHCFSNSGGVGRPISFYFQIGGLAVTPSTRLQQEQRAQSLRALMKTDPRRRHLVTGKEGAPRLYVSRKCKDWIYEWEHCIFDSRRFGADMHNAKEGKRDKDDHAIDDTEYMAAANFRWEPGARDHEDVKPDYKIMIKSGGY